MPTSPSRSAFPSALATLDKVAARTPDGVTLFDNLSLTFGSERTGVVGRNGAGKSTLMKILAGVQAADSGDIFIDGKKTSLDSTRAAMDQGIVLIHQELNLCDNLNVGQNIFQKSTAWGNQVRNSRVKPHERTKSAARMVPTRRTA